MGARTWIDANKLNLADTMFFVESCIELANSIEFIISGNMTDEEAKSEIDEFWLTANEILEKATITIGAVK